MARESLSTSPHKQKQKQSNKPLQNDPQHNTTTTFLNIVDAGMAWRHSIVNIIDRV